MWHTEVTIFCEKYICKFTHTHVCTYCLWIQLPFMYWVESLPPPPTVSMLQQYNITHTSGLFTATIHKSNIKFHTFPPGCLCWPLCAQLLQEHIFHKSYMSSVFGLLYFFSGDFLSTNSLLTTHTLCCLFVCEQGSANV